MAGGLLAWFVPTVGVSKTAVRTSAGAWTFGWDALVAVGTLALAIVTLVALFITKQSGDKAWRAANEQLELARHANAMPLLVDLFREHRSVRLAEARQYVYRGLRRVSPERGFDGIPKRKRQVVRELSWYYDNLGALVMSGVVDLEPISAYLGGSLVDTWSVLKPFVEAQRRRFPHPNDPERFQKYYEILVVLVTETPPEAARAAQEERQSTRLSPGASGR